MGVEEVVRSVAWTVAVGRRRCDGREVKSGQGKVISTAKRDKWVKKAENGNKMHSSMLLGRAPQRNPTSIISEPRFCKVILNYFGENLEKDNFCVASRTSFSSSISISPSLSLSLSISLSLDLSISLDQFINYVGGCKWQPPKTHHLRNNCSCLIRKQVWLTRRTRLHFFDGKLRESQKRPKTWKSSYNKGHVQH